MRYVRRPTRTTYSQRDEEKEALLRLAIVVVMALVVLVGLMLYGLRRLAQTIHAKSPPVAEESVNNETSPSSGFLRERAPREGAGGGSMGEGGAPATDADTRCRKRLEGIRKLVREYQSTYGTPPPDLSTIGVSNDEAVCPTSKEHYIYSSISGQISCPHSEHITY